MTLESGLLGSLSILICHITLITSVINLKYSLKKTIFLWLIPFGLTFGILLSLTLVLPVDKLYLPGFTISVLTFMGMYFFLSRDSMAKKCFLFFSEVNLFFIIFFIGHASSKYLFSGEMLPGLALRTVFYVLFIVAFLLWIRPRYLRFASQVEQGWWQLALAAALFALLLTGHCIYPKSIYAHTDNDTLLLVTVFVLMLLLYFVIFHTIYYMGKVAQSKQMELQVRLMAEQIATEQESSEASRRIRHDLRHHNLVIAEYAKKQDMEGLLRYIDLYETDAEKRISRRICDNTHVNYILLAYCKKADAQGIQVQVRAAVPKDLPVKGIHLTAILGNAFENAILACTRSQAEQPTISILIQTKGQKCTIYMKNTSLAPVTFADGRPISKTGGIGIPSIIHAAAHYRGETDFSQKDGFFITRILLDLQSQSGETSHAPEKEGKSPI